MTFMRTRANRLWAGLLVVALVALAPIGAEAQESEGQVDAAHHVMDSHKLDFSPIFSAQLPRLFLVERPDGSIGIEAFASTDAAIASGRYHAAGGGHGGGTAESQAAESGAEHGGSAESGDAAATGATAESDHGGGHGALASTIVPNQGHLLLDFSITKHVIWQLIAAIVLLVIFIGLARRYRRGQGRETAPKGIWQNMWEVTVIYMRDEVAKPTLGRHYRAYLPYVLSVFFFILFCNLFGLVPWGSSATGNITVTATLAGFTFVATHIAATKDYWKHIFWPEGPLFIKPLMIPVEILGMFTKPFALAIRLFANMTAGHMVVLNFIGLIFLFAHQYGPTAGWGVSVVSVLFSLFLYGLETLVALIQAYVFAILSSLFIGMAIVEHHDDEHAYEENPSELAGETASSEVHGDGQESQPASVEPAMAG